nr:hypothetical protein [Tanacetum cinerariifolium]
MYYPRFTKVIIDYLMTRKPSISRRNRINWHYVRDDVLFSSIKVVSRHQTTQQYGAILPIELTTDKIKNSKAYKEYYAYAMGEATPKPKASSRKKKDEGTGSKPGVSDVQSDDSKEEISWNSSDDEDVGGHEEGNKSDESDDDRDEGSDDDSDETVKAGVGKDDDDNDDEDDDDNDEEEELAKSDEEDTETGKGGDEVRESEGESNEEETRHEEEESFDLIPRTPEEKTGKGGDEVRESKGESDEEETRQEEEESFDPIPKTPEESEEESNDEEDQDLRLSEEERIQEEEDADELYRDVNINQGRGLQVTQNVEDSHVTLTPVNPDGTQESSSMSSFMTSMLNPISDVGVDSIFMTASSPIVSLQSQTPIMTPSTITRITTSGEAPIPPPAIPSIILDNLPTFNSAFRFEERLRSLETSFSEYRQTQIQTDRLQDSLQRENDEFLRNINENMKKMIKGQVKNQVKEQVTRILPRIEEFVNATLERSDEQRNLYKALVEAYDADKAILDTFGDSTILKRRREDDD